MVQLILRSKSMETKQHNQWKIMNLFAFNNKTRIVKLSHIISISRLHYKLGVCINREIKLKKKIKNFSKMHHHKKILSFLRGTKRPNILTTSPLIP